MKPGVLIAIFSLLYISCISQTEKEFVEKLDKAGLVTSFEKKAFLKDLALHEKNREKGDDFDDEYQKEIMAEPQYLLYLLTRIKIYSTAGTSSIFNFSPAPVVVVKGKEKELRQQLGKFAQKLFSGKFVSQKTKQEIENKIASTELLSEFEVASFAASLTEKEYFLTPTKYKKFADTLLSRELITEESYAVIMDKLFKGDFRDYNEPLRYLKNIVILDLTKYTGKPENYIDLAYKETGKAFPGLEFDSLEFSIQQDKKESSVGFTVYDMKVSLKKKGKSYAYQSFFDADYKNKEATDRSVLPEDYYKIFNKMLSDQLSPYRLHTVMIGKNNLGILPLTQKQFDGLMWSYSGMNLSGYIQLSYENFHNKLTSKKIKDAIAIYDSVGLLSHLTSLEKDSCINEIMGKEINYFSDILSSFKNLVFEIDLEYGVDEGQYRSLTKQIAGMSKGNFNPTDIVDTYNYEKRKKFEYGFTLKEKKYMVRLNQEDDWLDIGFWELIEKAVKELDRKGKFYYIHPSDGMRQIYLTNEQADVLQQKKIIELTESDIEN